MINEIVKKNGITFGVIMGVVSALLTSAIYAIDLKLFTSWWLGIVTILFYIVIAIVLLNKTKKEIGFFSYKDAFTTYFISALVAVIITTLFNILLFNVIDPGAKDTLNEIVVKYTVEMMQKFNAPAASINETIAKMKDNDQYSVGNLLKGAASNLVISAIFGLIMAAIFKSRTPQE
ncbi:DUF4199 domain-containing protein [Flavobacterium agrisoli]|uniref:DUF4199 domain-containing protein n=1 Tax=Flavobacterium agrisoli TaxID=2793066 RepID=A0A934UKP5_9FLAO|nr:DUF4199 domain-containing protein [Flavobacterium agrisoli]MBK0371192.1 DUF4199 domain-containing protein [Flavobacterium agrisoli]